MKKILGIALIIMFAVTVGVATAGTYQGKDRQTRKIGDQIFVARVILFPMKLHEEWIRFLFFLDRIYPPN